MGFSYFEKEQYNKDICKKRVCLEFCKLLFAKKGLFLQILQKGFFKVIKRWLWGVLVPIKRRMARIYRYFRLCLDALWVVILFCVPIKSLIDDGL